MTPYEMILALDLASTLALELFSGLKEGGAEITKDQFVELTKTLKERRAEAMAKISAH